VTSPRKKIIFLLPSLRGGGAERVVVTLLQHLHRRRFEPHLALVDAVGPCLTDVPQDVPIHDLKAGRARYAMPAIIRLAWKLRPQVVLSTLGHLNLVVILARPFLPRGVKLLVREGITVSACLAVDGKYAPVWKWLYRRFYKFADKIICQSDSMLIDLVQNFAVPRENTVRIYNPVDVDRIKRLADSLPNPYSGPSPRLVAAGRLCNQKGFDVLLDALALVRQTFPSAQLTILGEGPLEAGLKAQRDRLGLQEAVHFAGFQPNPYPYFKHADLFVLASRYEGLPNVVLESLALGVPVVATDCPGGIQEIHRLCLGGVTICQTDHESLAASMVSECARSRSQRPSGLGDLKRLGREFEVQEVIGCYEDLFSFLPDSAEA